MIDNVVNELKQQVGPFYQPRLATRTVLGLCCLLPAISVLANNDDDKSRAGGRQNDYCSATARAQFVACGYEQRDDYFTAQAVCFNETDDADRQTCLADRTANSKESKQLCQEQFDARRNLCAMLGEAQYDPSFRPENFVDPLQIGATVDPNPYWPLVPRTQWVYQDAGSGQQITVTVTEKTKQIEGVTCIVVNDVVRINGELIEDTDDWIAQDLQGNIWYCGEEVKDYESFSGDHPANPELVEIAGSFKVGRDGAKPGILMYATPTVGQIYRQEFAVGEAEDVAQVIHVNGDEAIFGFSCDRECVVTRDFSPLDPGVEENKFYKPGVGLILELGVGTTERVELISKSILP